MVQDDLPNLGYLLRLMTMTAEIVLAGILIALSHFTALLQFPWRMSGLAEARWKIPTCEVIRALGSFVSSLDVDLQRPRMIWPFRLFMDCVNRVIVMKAGVIAFALSASVPFLFATLIKPAFAECNSFGYCEWREYRVHDYSFQYRKCTSSAGYGSKPKQKCGAWRNRY
jgi:hypothetical protein